MRFYSCLIVFIISLMSFAHANITDEFTMSEDEFTGSVSFCSLMSFAHANITDKFMMLEDEFDGSVSFCSLMSFAHANITDKFITSEDEFTGSVSFYHKDTYNDEHDRLVTGYFFPWVVQLSDGDVALCIGLYAVNDEAIFADRVYIKTDDNSYSVPYSSGTAVRDAEYDYPHVYEGYVYEGYCLLYNKDIPATEDDVFFTYPFVSDSVIGDIYSTSSLKFRIGYEYVIELRDNDINIMCDCIDLYFALEAISEKSGSA